ncbi:MAG: hypothetical protein ACRDUV_03050 [Pseudonocardiaceae bacterium]
MFVEGHQGEVEEVDAAAKVLETQLAPHLGQTGDCHLPLLVAMAGAFRPIGAGSRPLGQPLTNHTN